MESRKHCFERVIAALGRPYCRGERYAVYRDDCLQLMPALEDRTFDLTVTSPPYNIGKEYETPLPLSTYLDWCECWMREINRLTAARGAFWLNLGYLQIEGRAKAAPLAYLLWDRCPMYLIQEVVWNYGAGVAARKCLSPRNEKFLWYVKDPEAYTFNLDEIRDPNVKYPNQKKNGKLRCNTIGKNPSDVWQIAKVTSGRNRSSSERAPHPAQFPLDLINRIVVGFSNPGDLVLDPFMGSGSTAESCLMNERFAVGFEVNREYCNYVSRRLKTSEREQRSVLFQ